MMPLTREWVQKAEADLRSAHREYRARKEPNYDLACFLCQQSVEKYLKARLQEATIEYPKTHDLVLLLDLVLKAEPLWEGMRQALHMLSQYGVVIRYPGSSADRIKAKKAIDAANEIVSLIRENLGIGDIARRKSPKRRRAR